MKSIQIVQRSALSAQPWGAGARGGQYEMENPCAPLRRISIDKKRSVFKHTFNAIRFVDYRIPQSHTACNNIPHGTLFFRHDVQGPPPLTLEMRNIDKLFNIHISNVGAKVDRIHQYIYVYGRGSSGNTWTVWRHDVRKKKKKNGNRKGTENGYGKHSFS